MFEIGEVVWVEYDGTEAFIGILAGVGEDEVMLEQIAEYKIHKSMTERLMRSCENAVNIQEWKNSRAQYLSYTGLLGLPALALGEQVVRTKLMYLIAEEAIRNGTGYIRNLDERMRIVLPRGGAVFKDAKVAIDEMIGKTAVAEEDTVEAVEADVDAEVEAFKETLEAFEGLDADDPEGSVSGNLGTPPDVEPNNKPDF